MSRLEVDQQALGESCERHHVRSLALFGSTAKGTATPESDVDLLVEFEPGREPGLIALATMEAELSRMLGDRPVDLRTPADLSRHFREHILATAEPAYGA